MTPPLKPKGPLQRVGVLCCLPDVLDELGVDRAQLLQDIGLAADAFDRPDALVPFSAISATLQAAADRAACPHIGVLVGQRFELSHISLLGDLIRHSSSVGHALGSYVVHQRLYSEVFTPFLHRYDHSGELGVAVYNAGYDKLAVVYDLLLAAAVSLMRQLCGAHWVPTEVRLTRSAPSSLAPYRAHFRCNLMFDAPNACIVLRAEDIDRPIPHADAERFKALEQEAINKFDVDLLALVRRSVRAMLVIGEPRAGRLADQFAMHERTLARRLQSQGTSFRAVVDEVRYDLARALLVDTAMSTEEVASAVGYAEAASFIRAFNRWSGLSPGAWRAEHVKRNASR